MGQLFGTDGIRGTPGIYPLTDEMIRKIGCATAQVASSRKPKIIIGKDTRLSGKDIEKILAKSITDCGTDVYLAGTITTPGLSFFTMKLPADAGIMISASHNKATDNGLKFFNSKGYKLSLKQEKSIEDIVSAPYSVHGTPYSKKGKIYNIKNAQGKYSKFLLSTVKTLNLKGIKIALDCAWGAASPFAKKIFTKLGAKLASIHDKPSGHNINIGGALNPALLKELVLKTGSDFGIAVDGDGDRGILVDETGRILDGDCIMAIMARYLIKNKQLRRNTVVGTVMSNYGLRVSLEEIGVKMLTADVGDKFVLESLLANNLNLGGEQSGHIIFLDYLPTPDGLLTALQLLNVMQETQKPLSALAGCMCKFPQILVNVKVREKKPFTEITALSERLSHFNNQLQNEGRILLRYSGTELLARVMVEGRDHSVITDIANSLAEHIRQEIGVEEAIDHKL